jgi:hypothetical protein
MLTGFSSAFDDVLIKRFNGKRYEKDSIKVPFVYAPKSHILQDLVGKTDTVKLPIMAVQIKSQGRDNDRTKNKLEEYTYKKPDGSYVNVKAVPWNIQVEMTILAKYQEDMDQIVENFSLHAEPYIIFSWREPKTGKDIRTEVVWDNNVTYTYPGDNQTPKDAPFRITATANFTIKGWLYRTNLVPVTPICFINADIITTNKFYCNYAELVAATADNARLEYDISGVPAIRYVSPYYLREGQSTSIKIQGTGFNNVQGVFLSGNNSEIYPLTTYQPFTATDTPFPAFDGYSITEFETLNPTEITFTLPPTSAMGFVDIIVVNQCGYGKLTVDANRCNRVENPYPTTMSEHYNWCVLQFPFLNGLVISNEFYTDVIDYTQTMITYDEESIDRDAIILKIRELMELGNVSVGDLS